MRFGQHFHTDRAVFAAQDRHQIGCAGQLDEVVFASGGNAFVVGGDQFQRSALQHPARCVDLFHGGLDAPFDGHGRGVGFLSERIVKADPDG